MRGKSALEYKKYKDAMKQVEREASFAELEEDIKNLKLPENKE